MTDAAEPLRDDSVSTADLHSAALRGIRWTVIVRPVVECISFVSMVVLARIIAPAEFGSYAVALVFAELMFVPSQAVGAALVQRPKAGREHLQTGFALSLLIGLAIVAITLIAASLIIVPIYGERTAYLVRLSTLGCIVNSANIVPLAVLQRRLDFRRWNIFQVVSALFGTCASITLAVLGFQGAALVLGGLAGSLAATVFIWSWARPPLPRLSRGPARELASYGVPAALSAVSWVGFRNCDYAIVGARLGALQAGFYFRAYTLGVEYQKKVSQVMGSMGFALLARSATSDQDALRSRMVRVLTLILFPALALLAIGAPVLVPRMFGPHWTPAVVPTQILAIGGAAVLVIDAIGSALMAGGRTRAILGYGWGHFLTYAVAVLVVSPLGIEAVAIAAATVHTIFLVVAYVLLLWRHGGRPLQTLSVACKELIHDVLPATVSCIGLAAVAVPLAVVLSRADVPALAYLAVMSSGGLIAYLVAMRIFYPESFCTLKNLVLHLMPKRSLRGIWRRPVVAGDAPVT